MDRRISRRLLDTSLLILVVGSFDERAVDEGGAGTDQGDQVGWVDHPLAVMSREVVPLFGGESA